MLVSRTMLQAVSEVMSFCAIALGYKKHFLTTLDGMRRTNSSRIVGFFEQMLVEILGFEKINASFEWC